MNGSPGGDSDSPLDSVPKPTFPVEYRQWLLTEFGVSVGDDSRAKYEDVSAQLYRDFGASKFWTALPPRLRTLNATYKVERGAPLLVSAGVAPELIIKPWDSFWEKSYRRNVFSNRRWPGAPDRGWVLPETWFTQIGDMVRTLIAVKYLDCMDRVATELSNLASEHGLVATVGRQATEEGYYATHVDVTVPIRVPAGLDTELLDTRVEIQVTTELQENIRDLAHRQYETRRMSRREPDDWRWDYRSEEFSANYLGHVLHYLEGMITHLREDSRDRDSD